MFGDDLADTLTNLKLVLLGTAEVNLGNNAKITSMDQTKRRLNVKTLLHLSMLIGECVSSVVREEQFSILWRTAFLTKLLVVIIELDEPSNKERVSVH